MAKALVIPVSFRNQVAQILDELHYMATEALEKMDIISKAHPFTIPGDRKSFMRKRAKITKTLLPKWSETTKENRVEALERIAEIYANVAESNLISKQIVDEIEGQERYYHTRDFLRFINSYWEIYFEQHILENTQEELNEKRERVAKAEALILVFSEFYEGQHTNQA